MVETSELLRIQGRAASLIEAERDLLRLQAGGILLIPAGFEQSLLRGEQATVAAFADASYLLIYRQVLTGLLSASGTFSAGVEIQRLAARGVPERAAIASGWPLRYAGRPLFNAVEGYATFVVPSVLLLILQQTILIGTGLVEGNRFVRGVARSPWPLSTVPLVLLGRALFYLLLYWFNAWFYLGPLSRWYGFPSEGQTLVSVLFAQPYLLGAIFLGLAATPFFHQPQRSMQVFAVTSMPMLLLAGVVWPAELLPAWVRTLSLLLPSTPAIGGFLRINMMGANLAEVFPEFLHSWILAVAYFVLACLFHWLAHRRVASHTPPVESDS
jgi:ABC-2 type transport system permease protein